MSEAPPPDFGDYEVIGLIKETGMSTIYKAQYRNSNSNRLYAIKIMNDSGPFKHPNRILEKEIAILKKLQGSPHIVQYVTHGWTGSKLYLVMDFVEGAHPFEGYGPGSTPYIRDDVIKTYVVQVAEALKYVHRHKCCHCDVRPKNILISPEKGAVLLDFGLAVELRGNLYQFEDGDERLDMIQRNDLQLDTRYHSSQHFTKGMDTTGDQYSLALFVIQCKRGGKLEDRFTNLDLPLVERQETIEQTFKDNPRLVNVLKIALMDEPNKRYQSIESFAHELVAALGGETVTDQGQPSPAETDATNTTPKPDPAAFRLDIPSHSPSIQTSSHPKIPRTFRRRSVITMAMSGVLALPLAWMKLGYQLFQVQPSSAGFGDSIRVYQGHSDTVNAVSWAPDSQSIVSASADSVQLWKPRNEDDRYVVTRRNGNILDVAWSPFSSTNYIAFCSGNKVYLLFGFPNPTVQDVFTAPGIVTSLSWSPAIPGMLAIAGAHGIVQVVQMSQSSGSMQGILQNTYSSSASNLAKVTWSQDGSYLAACSQAASPYIWIWSFDTTPKHRLTAPSNVLSIAWLPPSGNPENALAAGLADSPDQNKIPYVRVWKDIPDDEGLQEDYSYSDDYKGIDSIAWSPDGTHIAAGSDPYGNVYVWDARTKIAPQRFDKHHRTSSDFNRASNNNVSIKALAWSPDGRMIASGGTDNTVRVWASGI